MTDIRHLKYGARYFFADQHVDKIIYVGSVPLISVFLDWFAGLKIIKWWVGTDVLILFMYPPGKGKVIVFLHRVKMYLLKFVIYEHWFTSKKLMGEMPRRYINGRAKVFMRGDSDCYIKKISHKGFNVLIYRPLETKFNRWLYGLDLIDKLKTLYNREVTFIEADGGLNLKHYYPYIDAYIRPTRHDGFPRMVRECKVNNIPYYWSKNGKPKLKDIIKFIENRRLCADK
jgi:hypothetical protein